MKYYIDLNGRFTKILSDWGECQKYMKEMGGLNFKSFTSIDEAKKMLDGIIAGEISGYAPTSKSAAPLKKAAKYQLIDTMAPAVSSYIIGCDEVGKVEPFKQLMSVAVFADPAEEYVKKRAKLNAGDSKGHTKEADAAIGKEITGYEAYDDVDSIAHYNREYGVIYCIQILKNTEYNKNKENGINANSQLSFVHNKALLSVYDEAKKQGFEVDYFVIDDYINQPDSVNRFGKYIDAFKSGTRKINDLNDTKIYMTTGGESKYNDTVGLASNIGNYIDSLWQKKCTLDFLEKGIEFKSEWFSNFSAAADSEKGINRVFDLITEKCGDLDDSPVICKHTNYYVEYKEKRL